MDDPSTPASITNKPFGTISTLARSAESKPGGKYSRKLYLIAKEALSNRMPLGKLTIALR